MCLILQEIKFEIIEVLQPNSWMMGMELNWFESNLHVAFAEMSLRNALNSRDAMAVVVTLHKML